MDTWENSYKRRIHGKRAYLAHTKKIEIIPERRMQIGRNQSRKFFLVAAKLEALEITLKNKNPETDQLTKHFIKEIENM